MVLLINVPVPRLYWPNVCTSWTFVLIFVLVWRLYQSDVCKSDVCTVQPLERQTFVGSAFPLVRYMVCSQKEKIVSRKFRISFALKKYENFFEIRNAKILRRKIEFIKKMQNFCENSSFFENTSLIFRENFHGQKFALFLNFSLHLFSRNKYERTFSHFFARRFVRWKPNLSS